MISLSRAISTLIKNAGSWRAAWRLVLFSLRKEGLRGSARRIKRFIGRYGRSSPVLPRRVISPSPETYPNLRLWHEAVLTTKAPEHELFPQRARANGPPNVKALAFYLPQFHPFPENDAWWGMGFSEWRNVTRALPQFIGHYQPRLPADLGFYDLRTPGVLATQAELAKQAGLSGFCFYFYWFGGKTLMEEPLRMWRQAPGIDFPYCLCWANENWTRRWDGLENDILIAQQHSPEDDVAFIEHVSLYLNDPRYVRVDDKPLLLVYRADKLPDASATLQRWRAWWREHFTGELYIACVHAHAPHPDKAHNSPVDAGFDASVEFPPVGLPASEVSVDARALSENFVGKVYDYRAMVEEAKAVLPLHYVKFRGVMPSWDNTARRRNDGFIFHDSTPKEYRSWLHEALTYTRWFSHAGNPGLVFINAWNEWAEGAYLEPDLRFGHAYLNATSDALSAWHDSKMCCLQDAPRRSDVAVILHLHYPELAEEFQAALSNIECDIWISLTDRACFDLIRKYFPDARIFLVANRGRDIAPFLALGPLIWRLGYPLGLKLHSKRSPHRVDGDRWRRTLVQGLLPAGINTKALRVAMEIDTSIGIIAPDKHHLCLADYLGNNAPWLNRLERLTGIGILPDEKFIAGSMFWFRPDAMRLLFETSIHPGDFDFENGQVDGTLAHAIERFVGSCVRHAGYRVVQMHELPFTEISADEMPPRIFEPK